MTTTELALLLAQGAGKQQENPIAGFLPILVIFGAMYLLMIRPRQRQVRQHQALMSQLKQGDRVVAAGGIVGTIRRVDDDTLSLQVADNVVIKVDRGSVARKIEDAG
ncbi:MAG TPA: preprotein translocase subunit YajC [Actinomycetota bacterium]|nr:preprotein translocase subunit YajC [Actinomycetota bacterium]